MADANPTPEVPVAAPLKIEAYDLAVLLHFYYSLGDRTKEIWQPSTLRKLEALQLIERSFNEMRPIVVTERGAVYLEAVLRLPLPVQKWVMP